MINKRGQGLSTNAIVLIILAVVVLVLLIIGFTTGWAQLAPWLSSDNVDTIVQQCGVACSTEKTYDYCTAKRTLKAEGLEGGEKEGTCNEFATEVAYHPYGIGECPALQDQGDCKVPVMKGDGGLENPLDNPPADDGN